MKDAEKKAAHLSIRISAALRDRLKQAASTSGQSLSEEIAERLALSFEEPIKERFGGAKTYAFLRVVAIVLRDIRGMTGHAWHDQPFSFRHARDAIIWLLDHVEPPGAADAPDDAPILAHLIAAGPAGTSDQKSAAARKKLEALDLGKILARDRLVELIRVSHGDTRELDTDPAFRVTKELRNMVEPLAPLVGRTRASDLFRLYQLITKETER